MGDLIKHGELAVEQINDIQKNLLVSLRSKEAFWDKFCSHTRIADGMSSLEWRKLNVSELKPSDIANLTEGVTPASLTMTYCKFTVSPVDFGSWIGYTDKSKKYNFDDVVADAKIILGQRAFEEVEIRKANEFLAGCCTMDFSQGTNHFLKDLLKARTILKKNHAKPISGNKYGCILTPEQAAEVLIDYQTAITHTAQKESVINGYIGEIGGFMLFECADKVMYKAAVTAVACVAAKTEDEAVVSGKKYYTRASDSTGAGKLNDGTYKYTLVAEPATASIANYYEVTTEGNDAANAKGYCLFIGKTEYGMPVETVSFGDDAVKVIDKGLGTVGQYDANNGGYRPDALDQRGTVGYKVMGFAARILADEAIIRAEFDLGEGGEVKQDVVDANRMGYVSSSTSPVRE